MEIVQGLENPCDESQSMRVTWIADTLKRWCSFGRAPWHLLKWQCGQVDSLEKEKRKVCNSVRECKFAEVKAAEQSYG